ncbi:MAG: DUF5071 domain-containing protein [Acidimicrobiia bacterium]|nr:DUF5071 domain-containing protein [Acidimicrobiia bacterium]
MPGDVDQLYPGLDPTSLPRELIERLPRHKDDIERVESLVEIGYPDNAAALPYLAQWLQDANWPVARPVASYFARLGWALLPVVRTVLRGDDEAWAYWMLVLVVDELDDDLVRELEADIAPWATAGGGEGVDEVAEALLARI